MTKSAEGVFTTDELIDLATGILEIPRARLEPTWAYVQSKKYNGMIENGDCAQPNLIFYSIELPLIKQIYPPEVVNPKVKQLISAFYKKASDYSKERLATYKELRRYGLTIVQARKELGNIIPDAQVEILKMKYKRPFVYQYDLSCKDADLLFNLGIDKFVQLFYDRFYKPINK